MDFKVLIKQARIKAGISQASAAESIFRSRNAVVGYESGVSSPNPNQLAILCKLYKTTPNNLLGFQPEKESKNV